MINICVQSVQKKASYHDLLSVLKNIEEIRILSGPEDAEAILLPDDEPGYIRKDPAFRQFRSKCIAISDGDHLSYYIPALYASNFKCMLSKGRAQTVIHYLYSIENEPGKRNIWINRLKGSDFEKRWLYSFMGGSTCWTRKRLLKQYKNSSPEDVLVRGTDFYKHWNSTGNPEARSEQQRVYVETLLSSKFALCPRGSSSSSIRLFEAMELGCAPVVMADSWIPIEGVDWSFCLFVKESDVTRLDDIIRAHEGEWRERGALARRTFDETISAAKLGALLEKQIRHLLETRNETRERLIQTIYPLRRALDQTKAAARAALREAVLFGYKSAGRKFPYELNR
ncbi:exostosin domain-containing protein [Methylocapsa palsarum]|uniref:Exostosin family protein n=1 Tax=Methylocapsa palsarum TaxID=1612308 RepID=A0A1I3YST6_9HYPH|nr:exostosin family protein [Methylocapsa palsarum]SFK34875.1 Exostosin family protein [Methylocapsa palsarum]